MILLDTSVVIEIIEQGPGFDRCFTELQRFDPKFVHVSSITVFEVEVGLFDGSPNIRRRRGMWERFYTMLTSELVFVTVASIAADVVRATAKRGEQIGAMDALIAATALEFDLTLATRDRDFLRVPDLKVEMWR